MSGAIEISIPDIGDFADVLVTEVTVRPGDLVALEQTLLILESDKATIDVPSSHAGRIETITVRAGDRVSAGSVIGTLAPLAADDAGPVASPPPAGETDCDLLVIGGGPGGYSAAFRAADLGLRVVLVERDAVLGGVCLNAGCIPSKALLHVAALKEAAEGLSACGITFGAAAVDLDRMRAFKAGVVERLNGGLAAMAAMRKVEVIHGTARFAGPAEAMALLHAGGVRRLRFRQCIIAAGSAPVRLPFLPDDARIVDSTGALELPRVPPSLLVIGGGIIGVEMATVYSALGARVTLVERMERLLAGVDDDLVELWQRQNGHRFDHIRLQTTVEAVTADAEGLSVTFGGAAEGSGRFDMILHCVGRRPATDTLDLAMAGITADARGFIEVDRQLRSSAAHIFAIGDVTGGPMLAHKAVHQGHVAAEVAAGLKSAFDARVIPAVSFTDPEIAWAGLTEAAARAEGRQIHVARFPWSASGRALATGAEHGLTKLIFDPGSGRIEGGGIVGPGAGDMIGEIALAIEMGADAVDIGRTIHPHPTYGETIGLAAEVMEGTCTDLPPKRRRSG